MKDAMTYISFSADFLEPRLYFTHDRFDSSIGKKIPEELMQAIIDWNKSYQAVVHLSAESREKQTEKILQLDEEGLALAKKISLSFEPPAKVRYFSEGKLTVIGEVHGAEIIGGS